MRIFVCLLIVLLASPCLSEFYYNTIFPLNNTASATSVIIGQTTNKILVTTNNCIQYITYDSSSNYIYSRDVCFPSNIEKIACTEKVCFGANSSSIMVINEQGTIVGGVANGILDFPIVAIAADATNSTKDNLTLYIVTSDARNNILTFFYNASTQETTTNNLFSWTPSSSDIIILKSVGDVLLVAYSNNTVQVFSNTGLLLSSFGDDDDLSLIDIAFAKKTNITYVINKACNCIMFQSITGQNIGNFSYPFINPQALLIDSCQMYVVDDGNLLFFSPLNITVTSVVNATCPDAGNGYIATLVGGGTAPYQYLWTPSLNVVSSPSFLTAGNQTLTVTDHNMCKLSTVVYVPATFPDISLQFTTAQQKCPEFQDGVAGVSVTGGSGSPPYVYLLTLEDTTITTVTSNSPNNTFTGLAAHLVIPNVYHDQVDSPVFLDYSWAATKNAEDNTIPPHSGLYSYSFVPVNYDGIYFYCDSCINLQKHAGLSFWINAGPGPINYVQYLNVVISLFGTQELIVDILVAVNMPSIPFNTWVQGFVSFAPLDPTTNYTGIRFQDNSGRKVASPIYLDDVALVYKNTNYTVSVTDSNGCSASSYFAITQIPGMTLSLEKQRPSCYGRSDGSATVDVVGGTPPYSYEWMPIAANSASIYNLSATTGVETIVIYDDTLRAPFSDWSYDVVHSISTNCGTGHDVCISLASTVIGALYLHCGSGFIDTKTYSGIEFDMNGGANGSVGGQVYNFALVVFNTTSYEFGATSLSDLAGAMAVPNTWVHVVYDFSRVPSGKYDGFWVVNRVNTSQPLMYFDNIYLIKKTNKREALVDFYTVTVGDANNCTSQITNIAIVQPQPLSAYWNVQNAQCNSAADASAIINVIGGTPPYTYSWSHTTANLSSAHFLTAGEYYVTIEDVNGCLLENQSVVILEPPVLDLTVNIQNAQCYMGTGTAFASAQGGIGPYYYSFTSSGQNFTEIPQPNPLPLFLDGAEASVSLSGTDSSYSVSQLTSHAGYSSLLLNDNSILYFDFVSSVAANQYHGLQFWVNASSDFEGSIVCIISTNVALISLVQINSSDLVVDEWTQVSCDIFSGATGPIHQITIQVNSVDAVDIFIDDIVLIPRTNQFLPTFYGESGVPSGYIAQLSGSSGTYNVLVATSAGCSTTQTFVITSPPQLTATISYQWEANGEANATVVATGGTPPYYYFWPSTNQTTASALNLQSEQTYPVYVTDANGCYTTQYIVVPKPGTLGNYVVITHSVVLNSILGGVVGLCILLSIAAAGVLFFRVAYFKEKSPLFCGLIICGVFISYIAALTVLPEPNDPYCIAFPWLLGVAFTLVFGCLFLKTWRLYRILISSQQLKRVVITNIYVLKLVGLYFAIEIAYLIVWTIVDPPRAQYVLLIDGKTKQLQCVSAKFGFLFWGIFLGYKLIWMIFGAFMAVKTRHIFEEYKESHQIAFAIYNSMAVAIVSIPLGLILREIAYAPVIISVTAIILVFTATLIVLLGKIWLQILSGENLQEIKMKRPTMAARPTATQVRSYDNSSLSDRSTLYDSSVPIVQHAR